MNMRRMLCASLATVFLLLTACSAVSSSSPSSSDASSMPSSSADKPPVSDSGFQEGENADSGEKGTLYVVRYDLWRMRDRRFINEDRYHYDAVMLMVCLQGVLNKEKPTLYVIDTNEKDTYTRHYLTYMRQEEGDLLYGYKKQDIETFEEFLTVFADDIKRLGLIAWDQDVPATSLASATACGIDGYLPVRYCTEEDSVYTMLTETVGAEVKLNLVDRFTGKGTVWGTNRKSTGSAKCDAYVWAIENYMDDCDYEYAGCMLDAANLDKPYPESPMDFRITGTMLPDLDFLIYKQAFVFDLYVFPDAIPPDDPTQPAGTDRRILCEILQRLYDKHGGEDFTQVIGVPNIFCKYTDNSKYSNVELEFEWGRIVSSYNGVVDGDCGGLFSCFNCSVYTQFELEEQYYNNKPTALPEYDDTKIYINFVMGDYDGGAWMISRAHDYFTDERLGTLPLTWPFNPNLSARIPVAFDLVYNYRTENDFFTPEESAGYAYPGWIVAPEGSVRPISGLPDASEAWVAWNKRFYDKFDYSITPFVHNGAHGMSQLELEVVSRFSPDGFSSWNIPMEYRGMVGDTPICGSAWCVVTEDWDIADCIALMLERMNCNPRYRFVSFLSNLTSPTKMLAVVNNLKKTVPEVEIVDPYTFYGLMKQALKGQNAR